MADTAKPHRDVPTSKRFLWGVGGFADCLMYSGVNGLVDPIFNMGMGIDAKLIGLARSIPRFADMVIDPIIGHLSDNTHTRWGRRKPWMLAGALIASAVCIGMWFVPTGLGPVVKNAFVVTMMVLLFTFGYSLFVIPYNGQGYGMSTDYNERTHLFKWRQYTYVAATFITPGLFWLCTKIDVWFGGAASGTANGLYGIMWVGPIVGLLILATTLVPILFCGEGKDEQKARAKVPLRDAIAFTMKNKAFWPLVMGNFLLKFGMCATGNFFMYIFIYNLSHGNKMEGASRWYFFCLGINISTFLVVGLVVKLVDIFGKKPMLMILLLISSAAYASVWYTFRVYDTGTVADVAVWLTDHLYIAPTIAKTWPVFITAAGIGIFCNCLPMLFNSMLADVCDVDELASGHQRQAFYGATFATCDKIAMGAAMLLQGLLLTASGYEPKVADVSGVSAHTIEWWFKALLFTQPTGFVIAFVVAMLYPITRARAKEVRHQLDLRRAAAQK